jgi:intein/homing endonuclease
MFKKTLISNSKGILRRADMIKRPSQQLSGGGRNGLPMSLASTSLVNRMAPRPFSPFYEESNLNLPRERPEVHAWCRHYYDTDPLVGNALDLHSTYPLGSFGVKCEFKEIEDFFNAMLERLNFGTLIYDIAKEYFIIGEVFPYCQLNEDTGEWAEIVIQNPDYIEVKKHSLTSPVISLKPDAELQRIVTSTDPSDMALREQLDPEIIQYVLSGKAIPLDNQLISHIARKSAPYQVRGTSILTRVFKDLMLRDIYREAQFCYQDGTEVLTDRGFIDFKDLKLEDKIATTPLESGELKYHKPKAIHSFDYDGDMYNFKTRQVDCAVTPNHRMVVRDNMGKWKISRADQVKKSYKFRASHNGWNEGIEVGDIEFAGENVVAEQLMEFLGYWISDGCISRASRGYTINIAQSKNNNAYEKIKTCINKIPYNFKEYSRTIENYKVSNGDSVYTYNLQMSDFNFNNKALYEALENNFGKGAFNKYIPQWIMEYSPRLLKILLDALVAGDGNTRVRKNNKKYITYSSVSKKLADNVQEIAFKCGFSPSISTWISREGSTIYSVKWSDRKIKTYGINTDKRYPNNNSISTYHYKGKVWCPEVENGIFVTRWNGRISIHGNTIAQNHVTPLKVVKVGAADGSYRPGTDELEGIRQMLEQAIYDTNFTIVTHTGFEMQYVGATGQILPLDSEYERLEDRILTGLFTSKAFTHSEGPTYANASVALEVLQQRYVSFRNILEKWLERKVFAPISRIQDFTRYRNGVRELIIPKVNWQRINLKNNREYQGALEGLVRDNKVSLHSLYDALDLSYESEMTNILSEIEDQKEIAYKLQTPYLGKENINVAIENKEEAPAGGPDGAGALEDIGGGGGGGGMDLGGGGGGDMGGGLDLGGGGGGLDLGGGGGAEVGGGAPPAAGGAPPV